MSSVNIISLVAPKLDGYESEAEQIGRSRFMALCMDLGTNEAETAEIEKIANSFHYYVSSSGDGVELHREYLQSPYSDIIENGMPAPYTGGQGGLVHMPDGSTRSSNVPSQLWGNEIPDYAKTGTAAFEEMDRMQQTLFPQAVSDAVQASRSDLAKLAKEEAIKQIKQVRMG